MGPPNGVSQNLRGEEYNNIRSDIRVSNLMLAVGTAKNYKPPKYLEYPADIGEALDEVYLPKYVTISGTDVFVHIPGEKKCHTSINAKNAKTAMSHVLPKLTAYYTSIGLDFDTEHAKFRRSIEEYHALKSQIDA
jgi:hypothetical protein